LAVGIPHLPKYFRQRENGGEEELEGTSRGEGNAKGSREASESERERARPRLLDRTLAREGLGFRHLPSPASNQRLGSREDVGGGGRGGGRGLGHDEGGRR